MIVCLAIGLVFAGCSHHASPKAEPALIVDPTTAFKAGKQLVAEHHPEQAVAQFDKAIEIDPRYADAYNARGLIRQQSNDLNGALQDFNKVIELSPKGAEAYSNRGLLYLAAGQTDTAREKTSTTPSSWIRI